MLLTLLLFIGQFFDFSDISTKINEAKAGYISGLSSKSIQIDTKGKDIARKNVYLFSDKTTTVITDNEIIGINDDYSFLLRLQENRNWQISQISKSPPKEILNNRNFISLKEELPWMCHLCGVNLSTLEKAYDIKKQTIENDGDFIKVSLTVSKKTDGPIRFQEGKFWLHKDLLRLEKYDILVKRDNHLINYVGNKVYSKNYELEKETIVTKIPTAKIDVSTTYSFSYPSLSSEELIKSAFLSKYGFPEPEKIEALQIPWYLYLLFIFIICFGFKTFSERK